MKRWLMVLDTFLFFTVAPDVLAQGRNPAIVRKTDD
jgi:hypothetical protein